MDKKEREDARMFSKQRIITTKGETKISSNGVSEEPEEPQPPVDTIRGMSMINVKERMERLRNDMVNNVRDQLDAMLSDVMNDLEVINKTEKLDRFGLNKTETLYRDKSKSSKSEGLPEKEFSARNSVLTDLYEIKHFRTIRNIFVVILIVLCLHTVIYDLMHTGRASLGLNLIRLGFAKFSIVIEIWLVMMASSFGVYNASRYWAQQRASLPPKSYKLKAWDYGWLVLFVAYQIAFLTIPVKAIVWAGLPPMSKLVVITEEIRIVMKMHAFVRSTAGPVIAHKPHTDEEISFPGFSKFLYFMFAPTLVYRDTYPRTKEIRWRFALWHFTEVVLVMFNVSFIFERYFVPQFEDFGKRPFDVRSFVLTVYSTWLPGMLVFLSGFYCLLHAWMNGAAEVMRFADRLFYKDWWNATTYATFYRNWNVVVHDWLYTYIYKDVYENVTRKNRFLATFTVFFISAVVHEFLMAFTFGFFFPIMFMMFGVISFSLIFVMKTGHPAGNMFIWFSLFTGCGTMTSLYTIEYYARINCPSDKDGILDLIVPRSFTCF